MCVCLSVMFLLFPAPPPFPGQNMVIQGSRLICHDSRPVFMVIQGSRMLFMIQGRFLWLIMVSGGLLWFQVDFHGFQGSRLVVHSSRLVFYCSRSVFMVPGCFFMVLGWFISELSAGGAK